MGKSMQGCVIGGTRGWEGCLGLLGSAQEVPCDQEQHAEAVWIREGAEEAQVREGKLGYAGSVSHGSEKAVGLHKKCHMDWRRCTGVPSSFPSFLSSLPPFPSFSFPAGR